MCYSALIKKDIERIVQRYGAASIRKELEYYDRVSISNPKRFPRLADRVYPGHYAPVLYQEEDNRFVSLMRYGTYPPARLARAGYTSFNARSDNLKSPFWENAYKKHHGFVVLQAFYEWVAVKDLLKAGAVTLVKSELNLVSNRKREEQRSLLRVKSINRLLQK